MNSGTFKTRETVRLITAIALLVIGIILLFAPQFAMSVIVIIIGIVLLGYGIIQLIVNLTGRNRGNSGGNIAIPIIAIIIGVLLIVFRDGVASFILPLVIGIWAIITGIMSLIEASSVRHLGMGSWRFVTITGLAQLVLGIIMVIGVFTGTNVLGILLGVCLLIYGIMSIISFAIVARAKA